MKEAAEKLVSMNAANDQITPAQGGPWPHDFQNFEGVTTPNAQVNRYITFPLLQGGAVYTGAAGQFDGLYRVTVGVSDTNKPITLDVVSILTPPLLPRAKLYEPYSKGLHAHADVM